MSDPVNNVAENIAKIGDNSAKAFYDSATLMLRGVGTQHDTAMRAEQAAFQTAAAILMCIAERGGRVPAFKYNNKQEQENISADVNWLTLARIHTDRTNKEAGVQPAYNAMVAFTFDGMNCGRQTAQDVVQFAALCAHLGYTLADFNGDIKDMGDHIHVSVDWSEWQPGKSPMYMQPGCFKVKPVHVAYKESGTSKFYKHAVVARRVQNGEGHWVNEALPVQLVAINDSAYSFWLEPEDNVLSKVRVGRKTFKDVTAAFLKAQAAEQEQEKQPEPETQPEQEDQDQDQEGDDDEEDQDQDQDEGQENQPRQEQADKQPEQADKQENQPREQEQADKQEEDKQEGNDDDDDEGEDEVKSKAEIDLTKGDKERALLAITPEKVVEMARLYFVPDRIKQDEMIRKQAFGLFMTIFGALNAAGYGELIKNPVPERILEAMRTPGSITVTSNGR